MTSKALRDALGAAIDAFDSPIEEQTIETDFSADLDESTLHMRKACRALELAAYIIDRYHAEQKHFTAVIELSFQAIERTCQAALAMSQRIRDEHRWSHEDTLRDSHEAGLWDDEAAEGLRHLHESYRTLHYYDRGVPTLDKAIAMLKLANQIHHDLRESNLPHRDDCICAT